MWTCPYVQPLMARYEIIDSCNKYTMPLRFLNEVIEAQFESLARRSIMFRCGSLLGNYEVCEDVIGKLSPSDMVFGDGPSDN